MDKDRGLNDDDLKTITLLIRKATADECAAIAQRFNVQAQFLINKAEERLTMAIYDEGE